MAAKPLDLTGQRFGRLVAVALTGEIRHGYRVWRCQCDCGGSIDVPLLQLRVATGSTGTRSCGCLARELREKNFRPHMIKPRHGMSETVTYNRWQAMRARCNNPGASNYERYGARGIKVCERWALFENFFSDMGECPSGHSLERTDNGGNYEPRNCKWIPVGEQQSNTRRSKFFTHNGVTKTAAQWARSIGITDSAFHSRLRKGWPIEKVLTRKKCH